MLQSIREKTSGWFASIVLGLVILALGFFGIEGYLGSKVENYAARVEGPARVLGMFDKPVKDISTQEFRTRFDLVRQQERQEKGEAFDAAAFESLDNKRRVLDQLIDEAALGLLNEREGLALPNSAVQKKIASYDAFKLDGRFNKDKYVTVLQGQNMTPRQFEEMQRGDMLRAVLPEALLNSQFASDAELDGYLRLSRQTRELRVLEIPPPSVPVAAPTEAELQSWYAAHASRYRSPEQVAVEYVEIRAAGLPVSTVADEESLRKRYESVKSRYGKVEQKLGSHILVSVEPKATPAQVAAAEAKAKDLAARARAPGADFAKLAGEFSDDEGSKAAGGDLGAIEPGLFGAEFDKAFQALQLGQVSDPVRLPDGFHVLWFRQLLAGDTKPFEEVRAEIEAEFLESERERAFNDLTGKLVDAVYADPESLATAARELKLPVQRTALFSRQSGAGVAALEQVRKAAFSDAIKVDRQVSDQIEIEPNHVVLLRVIDHRPAAAIPLAQVRDRVSTDLITDRTAKASQARAEALLARVRKGESLDAIAAEVGRPIADLPAAGRQAPNPALQPLLDAAFRLPRPTAGQAEFALAKVEGSRPALVGVTKVTDGDLKALDAPTREKLKDQLARMRGAVDARAFIDALRKQYKVTVAEDRL